jgi:hypothetical protein
LLNRNPWLAKMINQRSCSTNQLPSRYCCTPQTEVSNHEQCVRSSSARTAKSNNRPTRSSYPVIAFTQPVQNSCINC